MGLQDILIRKCLNPAVIGDTPGQLTLRYSAVKMLPEEAKQYLSDACDVISLPESIQSAEADLAAGTVTIRYEGITSKKVLSWVNTVMDAVPAAVRRINTGESAKAVIDSMKTDLKNKF